MSSSVPFIPGLTLCEAFFHEIAEPLLMRHFPGLPYSAGLLGYGSDVLGYDDAVSTDHMWGPRFYLFLDEAGMTRREEIQRVFATNFPYTYRGFSVHFFEPDENDHGVRHPERICSGEVSPLVFFHTFSSKEKEEQTMARIANKKTGKLTKQYRDPCVFHASSRRRSYRRKGTSTRRKRASYVSYTTVNDPVANAIATIIVGGGFLALLMWLLPIFVPIFVGFILLWGVDKICKAKWNLPSGKWSMPASWGWTILTGVEMIVSFVIVLLIAIEEATMTALIVNLVIYIGLSAWILISKHNKIKKASVT